MNGKVLDIEGGCPNPGAKVVMYDQKDPSDADNQLWFEDRYGNIRSKLNDQLILDSSGELHALLFSFAGRSVCCLCCFFNERRFDSQVDRFPATYNVYSMRLFGEIGGATLEGAGSKYFWA